MNTELAVAARPAKFSAPVATHIVNRPRLHVRLTEGLDAGTTLVAAAAGWGKTLLVGSWVAAGAGGRAVAWVTLDGADDDERVFWHTMATAVLPVADDAARDGLRLVASAGANVPDLPSEFAIALGQMRRRVVVVLDNLHEVRSPEVHAGLVRLVERPLPTLSLIVTTRHDPPWPLQRLRLAGLLAEVRAGDLAFHRDEAAALAAQLEVDLTASQLDRLIARTEGWAAGLRLAALHLRGCADVEAAVESFSGDDHSVAGYLVTEVLDRQAPELVEFLERISDVDLVSAGLANALTGREDGEAVLAELAASHLFVEAVGHPGRWYRLHRLLADILRARPMPPRRRRDLHRRAAEWFRDHGMPLAAIRSALRGGLWSLAGDLIGTHLVTLALRGAAHELEQALAEVPQSVLFGRAELATGLAGARVVQGVGTELTSLIASARTGARQLPTARAERVEVLLDLIAGAHARLAGDFDAAAAAYRRVPDQPAPLARLGFAGAEIVPVVVHSNLGTAEMWIGDLARAARNLGAAADHGSGAPALPHINAAAYLALLHCERGELDTAVAMAREVAAKAASLGWARTPQVVAAYLAMARVMLDRDELAEIDAWLHRVAEVVSVDPEPHLQLAAALVLAARREAVADHERALSGLRGAASRLAAWIPPRALAEQWMLTEAALLVRSGDRARARARLDAVGAPRTAAGAIAAARVYLLLGDAPAAERELPDGDADSPRTAVGVHLVRALAAQAAGDDALALDRLEDALLAAAPTALRRPFLTAAEELRDLLQQRVERGSVAPAFAVDLLRRMAGAPADELAARRALVDPLTERETTILRYLASTLSNAEIATELYVSVNTVKTHQRTVYRKLGAAGRRDAVVRARALRLL